MPSDSCGSRKKTTSFNTLFFLPSPFYQPDCPPDSLHTYANEFLPNNKPETQDSCPVASLLWIVTTGLPAHYLSPLPFKTLQKLPITQKIKPKLSFWYHLLAHLLIFMLSNLSHLFTGLVHYLKLCRFHAALLFSLYVQDGFVGSKFLGHQHSPSEPVDIAPLSLGSFCWKKQIMILSI